MRGARRALVVVIVTVAVAAGLAAEVVPAIPATVDEALALGYERLVVRVAFADRSEIAAVASWVEPWEVNLDQGFLIVDVDWEGYLRLVDLGLAVELDGKRTVRLNRPLEPLKGQTEGIPGYPCYRTVEETLATGAALTAAHPGLAQWIDIGDSWEKATPGGLPGYDLMVLRLTNPSVGGDKPDLWVEGAIHARELTTAETATRFAEHLLAGYDVDPDVTWLLDHHDIHILLQTNPDGRKHAEAGESWRKNTNGAYCGATSSSRGADLNRNFDFYWGCCGGSSSYECDQDFRGPSPASEPETQAIQGYVASNFPDWRPDDLTTPAPPDAAGLFIDLHSYGGDVLTAFGFQEPPAPNDTQYLTLGRKLAFFNGYEARLGSLYPVDGSTKDWAYGRLGVPAFTIEMGTDFFEDCAPFESAIYPDNLEALIYAAKAARAPWVLAAGPEVVAPTPLPNVIEPGASLTMTATADDTRYESGSGEPTQPIASAQLFIDVPPWSTGATPISMAPADGSFNSTVEGVTATIDTTGLADGRHTAFLRASDSAGSQGVVSAAFFWVLDPATAGRLEGTVRSAETGQPVAATVTAGPFTTATDPADGSYQLLLPPGTYDVTAAADGYAAATEAGVIAVGGVATPLDFLLIPYVAVLDDDVEGGNIGWTPQAPWAITAEASASPTHSWTDSPGGNYGNGQSTSLTSPLLDLTGLQGATLQFAHIYDLESGWDFGSVEVSSDAGASWSTVATYSGQQSSWQTVTIPVPELDGVAAARVRFRLATDGSVTADGWHVDDILLQGWAPPSPGFSLDATPDALAICAGDAAEYSIDVGAISGFANPVTLAASGQPAGATAGFAPNPVTPPGTSLLTVGNTGGAAGGSYTVTVSGSASGSTDRSIEVGLEVAAGVAAPPSPAAPANGATGQPLRPVFQWSPAAGAASYRLEVDDDPAFGSPEISETGIVGTTFTPSFDLDAGTSYVWRLWSDNPCGTGVASAVFWFETLASLPFADGFESGDTAGWSATVP